MARKRSKKKAKRPDTRQVDLLSGIDADPRPSDPSEAPSGGGPPSSSGDRAEPVPVEKGSADKVLRPADAARQVGLGGQASERPSLDATSPEAGSKGSADPREAPASKSPTKLEGTPIAPAATSVRSSGEALARAKELVERGKISEAIDLYREIVETSPKSVKARNNLGALLDGLGQHHLALVQFEAAEELDPDSVEVLTNLGSTLGALSRYEEAEVKLLAALRLAPEDLGVRSAFGVLSFRRSTYAQAVQELSWACERDPDDGNNQYYLGESLNRLGRYDEAIAPLERATQLRPHDSRAFYTLGHLYDRKRLPKEAAEMFRRANELQGR